MVVFLVTSKIKNKPLVVACCCYPKNAVATKACTKLCKQLIATGTCDNPECRYAHTHEDLVELFVMAVGDLNGGCVAGRNSARCHLDKLYMEYLSKRRSELLSWALGKIGRDRYSIPSYQAML